MRTIAKLITATLILLPLLNITGCACHADPGYHKVKHEYGDK